MEFLIAVVIGCLFGYGYFRAVILKTSFQAIKAKPWRYVLYGILAVLLMAYSTGCGLIGQEKEADNPALKVFSAANWEEEVLKSKKPVLVDFWAPWCGPCRMEGPIVSKLTDAVGDKAIVGKLNVDEQGGIASRYGIQGIPTLIVFMNGKILDQFTGMTDGETLKEALEKAGKKL